MTTENAVPQLAPAPSSAPRRRAVRRVLMLGVPLLVLGASLLVYLQGGRYVETDNAYVKADKVPVSAQVAATVSEVLVQDNQPVHAGDVLFRLDPAQFEVSEAKALARLAQVKLDLQALRASYREKQAEIQLANTRLAFALKDQQRQAELKEKQFVSATRYDDATLSAQLARQQMATLEQDLTRVASQLGQSLYGALEQHPSYLAAKAEWEQARLNRQHTEVRAPVDGTASRTPKPGQYLQAGATAMALVTDGTPWVEANLTETDLTHVHPGQTVELRVDTFPDQVWHAKVESLSPATGSEFSVIPAQNATGNWVKIAQRLPVRIALEANAGLPALRAGLSAVVSIDTGHRRSLSDLLP